MLNGIITIVVYHNDCVTLGSQHINYRQYINYSQCLFYRILKIMATYDYLFNDNNILFSNVEMKAGSLFSPG